MSLITPLMSRSLTDDDVFEDVRVVVRGGGHLASGKDQDTVRTGPSLCRLLTLFTALPNKGAASWLSSQ